ncbi:uncharacterized protein LOC117341838 [Pecten maximus]|uniref:uncharacterized protein LOC117341838 n=1 Tax=Pecten maximus TaxID=6579 RepID=UPI001458CD84|nr:uncharacterized protein LOC117341838 [Pecten maximus]
MRIVKPGQFGEEHWHLHSKPPGCTLVVLGKSEDGHSQKQCSTLMNSTSSEDTGIDVNDQSWKEGRRIVEFGILLSHVQYCKFCRLGPVPLTYRTVVGELQKGLGGYLYARCENPDCEQINRVPYGSMHRVSESRKGMPCFTAKTKLGTAMIDSLGGADRVNNFLSVLNLKPISQKNLKVMEKRAGDFVESVAKSSTEIAAKNSFQLEMEDIGYEESAEAQKAMGEEIDDLGISLLDDASPSIQKLLHQRTVMTPESERSELGQFKDSASILSSILKDKPHDRKKKRKAPHYNLKCKKRLMSEFPTKTRQGMSCAVDTAWHKRGFDSLTSHTFFMSKAKYGKKVVKTVVGHRTCGTCKWWQRNRPGQKIRKHRYVHNHTGSARLMESVSGVQGIKDLKDSGTPVEILEGDGDNTMISRIKHDLGITMKKRLDRNHVVKNVGK